MSFGMKHKNNQTTSSSPPELAELVRVFLVLIMAMSASLTIITHASQICGISFSLYTIIDAFVAIIVAGLVL